MFFTYVCALLLNYKTEYCEKKELIVPPIEKSLQNFGSKNNEKLNPEYFKVVVWNIYKSEKKNWLEDYINLGNENDLMLIQEAHLNPTFLESFQYLNQFFFTHATSFIFKNENIGTGTLTASKYKTGQALMIRSTDGEPIINTPKTISVLYLPMKGTSTQLLTLNIHGLNATKTEDFKTQLESTITLINEHRGPILFAGDFNTRNKKRMNYLKSFFSQLKFETVEWPNDKRKKFLGYPLDHAYIKGLKLLSSNVRDDIKSSDHKALELELSYPLSEFK